VSGRSGRHRPEAADHRVGIESVEQLHHVIERAVVGHAEVEQRDGMRRSQLGDQLRFAFEPPPLVVGDGADGIAGHRRSNQLDGSRPCQQPMVGLPHFAHAAGAQALHQAVAAKLAGAADFPAQGVHHARAHVRNDHN
jgi:hypothetical protein